MALNLDARQRAMLQDMGITVWAPRAAPAAAVAVALADPAPVVAQAPVAPAAPTPIAVTPVFAPVAAPVAAAQPVASPAPAAPAVQAPATPAAPIAAVPRTATAPWFMAPVVHAFADTAAASPAADADADAGWLVLLECADPTDPWAGEAGVLLGNMLRALRLHHHPRVRIAPLTRQAPAEGVESLEPMGPALQAELAGHPPARVLLLGLHAARAVLDRSEPLGPLRAEIHQLHGVPTVVSYDPAYLLRAAHAKPGAWNDLCRAHALRPPPATA